jgi:hypothetical protein
MEFIQFFRSVTISLLVLHFNMAMPTTEKM